MKKISGYQNSGNQPSQFPVANGSGLINALPVGILGADGTVLMTANNVNSFVTAGGGVNPIAVTFYSAV